MVAGRVPAYRFTSRAAVAGPAGGLCHQPERAFPSDNRASQKQMGAPELRPSVQHQLQRPQSVGERRYDGRATDPETGRHTRGGAEKTEYLQGNDRPRDQVLQIQENPPRIQGIHH